MFNRVSFVDKLINSLREDLTKLSPGVRTELLQTVDLVAEQLKDMQIEMDRMRTSLRNYNKEAVKNVTN